MTKRSRSPSCSTWRSRANPGEIVIEDWCIGCGLCATNCPYGSIQMHDIGVIPEGARGWRYHPATETLRWTEPGFSDRRWLAGRAPFRNDRDFREGLRRSGAQALEEEPWTGEICFRYE